MTFYFICVVARVSDINVKLSCFFKIIHTAPVSCNKRGMALYFFFFFFLPYSDSRV
jgi:hypothetical protein